MSVAVSISWWSQENHHKWIEAFEGYIYSMWTASLVYSSKELGRITYNNYASTKSITLSRASIELCMYVLGYSGQCSVEELVTLSLSIFSILFEVVWAHPQSLQHLGSCLHQLQEHVQLAVCV